MSQNRLSTVAARGVQVPFGDAPPLGGAIHQSTVGVHPDIATSERILAGDTPGYSYYRFGHHNSDELAATVAALEGAQAATCGASGMAVVAASLPVTPRASTPSRAICCAAVGPSAPSLEDVATTISHPATSSHRNVAPERRVELGISDGLLRLSVGIEDSEDLAATIGDALDRCS